jgi:hypothetical protein
VLLVVRAARRAPPDGRHAARTLEHAPATPGSRAAAAAAAQSEETQAALRGSAARCADILRGPAVDAVLDTTATTTTTAAATTSRIVRCMKRGSEGGGHHMSKKGSEFWRHKLRQREYSYRTAGLCTEWFPERSPEPGFRVVMPMGGEWHVILSDDFVLFREQAQHHLLTYRRCRAREFNTVRALQEWQAREQHVRDCVVQQTLALWCACKRRDARSHYRIGRDVRGLIVRRYWHLRVATEQEKL